MALWVTGAHLALAVMWFRALPTGERFEHAVQFTVLCAVPFLLLAATLVYTSAYGSGLEQSPWFGNANGGSGGAFVAWRGYDATMREFVSWGLYSPDHFMGILRLTLRLAPAALVIPLAFRRSRETTFLLAGVLGGLLLVTIWNLDFGFERDEKFALYGVPAHLYLLWRFVRHRRFTWLVAGSAAALVYALNSGPSWSLPDAVRDTTTRSSSNLAIEADHS